jgi:hypothetical protein
MKFKPAPFGLYKLDEKTGHYKPVRPIKDDVTYSQAIARLFAQHRYQEERK